ncbi:alanine racemase [Aeromonas bivalvium]|uniref:alanine racemase n=1 Tax=Aeromonas bivalvium TaxID=440079 RepID=UPI0005AB89B3|nr:alanine racemase [Aeromonas bivalvium]
MRAEISVAALRHNVKVLQAQAGDRRIMAVLKANAYGHGMVQMAQALAEAPAFAVARVDEGIQLRRHGIRQPILVLGGFHDGQQLAQMAEWELQTTLHCHEQVTLLEQAAPSRPVTLWLKIDTGMNRLGIRGEELAAVLARLARCPGVTQPVRQMTHFGRADELDCEATAEQITRFHALTRHLPGEKALANSAGLLGWADALGDWVRPGLALYGISPFAGESGRDRGLRPVMTLKSRLMAVRDCPAGAPVGYGAHWHAPQVTRLGVVATGYGDGYPRLAPTGTPMLINGREVPIVGRVSMDMLTVDLGPAATDRVGDEVVLWGEGLPVERVAEHIGTIPYELVTRLTGRVAWQMC